jgi:ankyrin repeat protein
MNKIIVALTIFCITAHMNAMEQNENVRSDFVSKLRYNNLSDKEAAQLVRDAHDNYENIDKQNFAQQTPLIIAAEKGYTKTVEILLIHKADINAKDIGGQTALMKAAQMGHDEIVKILLDNRAYTTITTPLSLANSLSNTGKRKTALDFAKAACQKTSDEQTKERYNKIITLLSKK